VTKRAEALIAAVYLAGIHSRFGQARAALEHFQGLMRQHLGALVKGGRCSPCSREP
jgi:hypothetical protein